MTGPRIEPTAPPSGGGPRYRLRIALLTARVLWGIACVYAAYLAEALTFRRRR